MLSRQTPWQRVGFFLNGTATPQSGPGFVPHCPPLAVVADQGTTPHPAAVVVAATLTKPTASLVVGGHRAAAAGTLRKSNGPKQVWHGISDLTQVLQLDRSDTAYANVEESSNWTLPKLK
jgi:hypothetical protein